MLFVTLDNKLQVLYRGKQMSSLIIWLVLLLISRTNVCQVPSKHFLLLYSNSSRSIKYIFRNEKKSSKYNFHFYANLICSTFLEEFKKTGLSFQWKLAGSIFWFGT
jgi:hypothetical protein